MDPAFLTLALFLPRVAMFYFWLNSGLPPLPMPSWTEIILAVAVPRFIVLFLIFRTMGLCGWFWIHLLVAIAVYGGSAYRASRE